MTDFIANSFTLSGSGSLATASNVPPLAGEGGIQVIQGLLVNQFPSGVRYVARFVGEPNVPGDILRMRRSVYELMRRMGTPVIIKPMFTERDVDEGTADPSPGLDDVYKQTRNRDPLSHGIGYVSKEKSVDEWYNNDGFLTTSRTSPGAGWFPAPRYRGYGPGVLTFIIEPDATEDFFKHTEAGVLIKVQTATAQTAWWPDINDNDLVIQCTLDDQGNILATQDRYQCKMTNPVSIRGMDNRGRREYTADFGNRFIVNQTFQMALLPRPHELYAVESDR